MPKCYRCGDFVFLHESELIKKLEDQLPEPIQEKYAQNFIHAKGCSPLIFDKQGHTIVCAKCFGELIHKAFEE
jgi:hypothetical protein